MIQWCIDRYKKMESLRQWAVWCVIAILLSVVNDRGMMHVLPNLFSFKGALGQLPYFLQVWAPAGLRGSFVVQAALSVCLCGWRRSWVWH